MKKIVYILCMWAVTPTVIFGMRFAHRMKTVSSTSLTYPSRFSIHNFSKSFGHHGEKPLSACRGIPIRAIASKAPDLQSNIKKNFSYSSIDFCLFIEAINKGNLERVKEITNSYPGYRHLVRNHEIYLAQAIKSSSTPQVIDFLIKDVGCSAKAKYEKLNLLFFSLHNPGITKVLLSHGANPLEKDPSQMMGMSPYDFALNAVKYHMERASTENNTPYATALEVCTLMEDAIRTQDKK